jgi:hypothetical protein
MTSIIRCLNVWDLSPILKMVLRRVNVRFEQSALQHHDPTKVRFGPDLFPHLRTTGAELMSAKGCERPLPPVTRMTAKPALQSSVQSAANGSNEPFVTEAPASMFAYAENALCPLLPFAVLPNVAVQLSESGHSTLKFTCRPWESDFTPNRTFSTKSALNQPSTRFSRTVALRKRPLGVVLHRAGTNPTDSRP